MGPVPTVCWNLSPGARLKNAASLPPSGISSGNRLTQRLSAALTLRATYADPKIGVFNYAVTALITAKAITMASDNEPAVIFRTLMLAEPAAD